MNTNVQLSAALTLVGWLGLTGVAAAAETSGVTAYVPIHQIGYLVAVTVCTLTIGFFLGNSTARRRIAKNLVNETSLSDRIRSEEDTTDGAGSGLRKDSPEERRQRILDTVFGDKGSLFYANCSEVRNFMCENAPSINADSHVQLVKELMDAAGTDQVFVCEDYTDLVGVIDRRDLIHPNGKFARDVMSTKMPVVEPFDSLRDVADLMLNEGYSCVPVCRGKRLVGMISTLDLILIMECAFDLLQQFAEEFQGDTVPA